MVRLNDLINIYEKDVKINVKNKKKIYVFEKHKIEYLVYICDILNNNLYQGCRYNLFLIKEPKVRLIMSESIINKIINHYVARFILEPKLVKYLSDCNVATRKGMGLDYGIKLLKNILKEIKSIKLFISSN